MIAQRSSVYCTEIYIILLDKSAVCKTDAASLGLEALEATLNEQLANIIRTLRIHLRLIIIIFHPETDRRMRI